ncbi:zinc metalloproteinase nas-13 [Drosophila ficusphila]|uniref:zinc metalloproteinase nas-13 n=1 Tax=Drosophila ficusphila TaxID=30025 RepID=UPI0007E84435|nr:zinc metalloproteinase nas-13 [Drosophila ficusphila]
MHFLVLALLLAIGSSANGRPSTEDDILEDDIKLIPEQLKFFEGNPASRVVQLWSEYYWKDRTLVYSFAGGFSNLDKTRVEGAMSAISSQTCVRFRRTANPKEPQVIIQRQGSGCWSYVGFLGLTNQPLNLGSNCMSSWTIQHELLHALAFFHSQSDPQRDRYVKINTENIQPGYEHNFDKLLASEGTDFGIGYDYDSIMHYGPYAFSKNGKPTIVPYQKNAKIGQARKLSPKDVAALKRMYC